MITRYEQRGIRWLSVEVRQRIFAPSKTWPKEEAYDLMNQARRSSRSVGACLVADPVVTFGATQRLS